MRTFLTAVLATIVLTSCAAQQPLLKQTASGYPEGVFQSTNVDTVRSKIMNACSSMGVMVQEATGNQVTCSKRLEGSQAILAQFAIGNSYSTPPEQKVKFIIYQIGPDVKVTAQQWVETQMPYGQMRRMELNSNDQNNGIQQMLFNVGAR